MYILKNAFLSIKRNKGRNVLIGIIILVLSSTTTIALAISNSSQKLISSYENKYDITASISMNRENMMASFDPDDAEDSKAKLQEKFLSASTLSLEEIEKYGNSNYVSSYYYTMKVGVDAKDLEAASMSGKKSSNEKNPGSEMSMGRRDDFRNQTSGDFTITGYSSITAMSDFINGTYTITSGEVSDDFSSNTCVINQELATLNNIELGDTITIIDPTNEDLSYKLEVTGFFQEQDSVENAQGMSMFTNSVNMILTNSSVVNQMMEKNEELSVEINPTFLLTSREVVEDFSEEVAEKGLSEYLTVTTNLDQIDGATTTIANVSNFATTFLIITLIIGAIVLFVINMINIRERKYEIGVLRTIGMKKSRLVLQFVLELFMISFATIMLGAGVGACMSVPVSNSLLQNEVEASQKENTEINQNFGRGEEKKNKQQFSGVTSIQAYDSINATVDLTVLIKLLGIGILLTILSSSAAMIHIQRFSPLTILKERS